MSSGDDEAFYGPDPVIGSVLQERFRIESVLGHGRTGRVYRATQFPMNRPVAVKLLRSDIEPMDEALNRRFGVIVGKSARLSHPHTVTLIDYGATEEGQLFIAMELMAGPPLASILDREAPFDWERAVDLTLQTARSLRDAHYNGVVHRGLSPHNLFVVEGDDEREFVKVSDFGVFGVFPFGAQRPPPEIHRSRKNWDASLAYTAPEQLVPGSVDARVDVYALGCVLFEMLSDRPPFIGRSATEIAQQHLEAEPPMLEELGFLVPEPLELAIRGCLEKSPSNRIGSMSDLMLRLKEALGASLTGDLTLSSSTLPTPEITASETARRPASSITAPGSLATAEAAFLPPRSEEVPSIRTPWPRRLAVAGAGVAAGALTALIWWNAGTGDPEPSLAPEPSTEASEDLATVPVSAVSTPEGAEVYVDGELVGATPVDWDQARTVGEAVVILRKEGFVEAVDRVVFDAPRSMVFTLEPAPDSPSPGADSADADDFKQNPY